MNNQEILKQLLDGYHLEPEELEKAKKLVKGLQMQLDQRELSRYKVTFEEIRYHDFEVRAKNITTANQLAEDVYYGNEKENVDYSKVKKLKIRDGENNYIESMRL